MSNLPVHSGPDDIAAHPRHTGHRWLDLILAVSAIFISGVSLVVAIEHGHIQKELVAANSWPFLQVQIDNGFGPDKDVAIGVANGGIGPAKIKSVRILLDGRAVESPADLLQRCCGLPADPVAAGLILPKGASEQLADGTVLRAGDSTQMLTVRLDGADPVFMKKLKATLMRLRFEACYCSVLDECFRSNLYTTETHEVDECPAPATPYRFSDLPLTPPAGAAPPRS